MIRILLAEDQAMVRGALSALLGLEPDIEVLGSAADGEAAWRMLQQLQPDILVTDIEMPGLSGLELAQRIARHELPIKVVIVTTFARAGFLRRALEAGVLGYLLKDAPAENLAEALRKVKQGIRAIDPQLALDAWSQADPLTDRERRVLRLAGEGRTASEIAEQLGLSHGTVRNYLSECIGKLGVANRIEAYRLAACFFGYFLDGAHPCAPPYGPATPFRAAPAARCTSKESDTPPQSRKRAAGNPRRPHSILPACHRLEHAIAAHPQVEQRRTHVHQHRGEQHVGQQAVRIAQRGVQRRGVRHDRRQVQATAQHDRVAASRQHRPADQRHRQHQRVQHPVRSLRRQHLPRGKIRWQRRWAMAQAVVQAQHRQQQDGDTQRPVQVSTLR